MTFNPNDYLVKLKGKEYLEVKYRIVWFRDEWPHGTIDSEHVEISDKHAIFRATVGKIDAEGNVKGTATGYGSETVKDFGDFIEKAETKAIGRALAALGYGTAFAPELDEGERIVDAPVTPQRAPQAPHPPRNAPKPANTTPDTPAPANLDRERVLKALHAEGKKHGMEHIDLHNLIVAKGFDSMTTAPVEALVDLGKAVKNDPGKLKSWLASQAELMPSPDDVPNPDRFTS